jgi:GntR family transcriptional regulator
MSQPVHMSIRDDLRIRISTGEWNTGERLPSEADLAARYGVARMTIRQAVGALAAEGIVVRRQGLGTFAAEQIPTGSANGLMSFAEEMAGEGDDVQTSLIKASVDEPPPAAREALRLGESAAAVLVRRVRAVNGSPVVVQSSWLPFARFAGLIAKPLLDGSLYAMVEDRFGVRIVRARQIITAAAVDAYNAALLGLQPGDPILLAVRTTYDSSNLAIEYATSAMRPGYPIETVMEREPSARMIG